MSWLSELFGGGGEDPLAVAQRQQMAQQEAQNAFLTQQQQSAQAEEQRRQVEQNSYLQAIAQLQSQIQSMQNPEPTPTPTPEPPPEQVPGGPSPEELAQQLADLRSGAMSSLQGAFGGPEYANTFIPSTYDDAAIESEYGKQRGTADQYISNLLNRHVITQTGANAAEGNLDTQGARVRTQLNDLGSTLLGQGRGALTDIFGRGAAAAGSLNLGDTFDPSLYRSQADTALSEFGRDFGDKFTSGVSGNLFDTSGLASIAGGAQGAQNLAFDPVAVSGGKGPAGLTPQTEEEKRRSAAVF